MPPAFREEPVAEVRDLTRRFGDKTALAEVSLAVPRGVVYGLVGANGAGKTTLIRHLLGLLKAQTGAVRVCGRVPVREPVEVLSRVGYLSEEIDLPGWIRVDELLAYMRAFYPTWDDAYAEDLRQQFELDPSAKLKALSKGQRARAGLIAALAYRPELLVLDEPSSGLDPIVRRDILGAIVRTIADEGRTVIFSSHLLDEVERVSECVAMLKEGRLVFAGPLDDVKARYRRLTVRWEATERPPALAGVLGWRASGREWTAVACTSTEELAIRLSAYGAEILEQRPLSLDEIFLAQSAREAQSAEA